MNELQEIDSKIMEINADLANAKQNNDRELILAITKLLDSMTTKRNIISAGAVEAVNKSMLDAVKVAVKKSVVEAFQQMKKEEKEYVITISSCSDSKLRNLLRNIHITVDKGNLELTATETFEAFKWESNEAEDTTRAATHIENQLKKFGVKFGRCGYEIHDVHTLRDNLSIDDPKTGNIRGGTDIIISPYGKPASFAFQANCVAIELKTMETVKDNGFGSFTAQGCLELIGSNYHSNQMTVVLVTDICTGAVIFTLERSEEDLYVLMYEDVNLSVAATFIAKHLNDYCVPVTRYNLKNARKESDEVLKLFKKKRVSEPDCLVLEHFNDMLPETLPNSRERAEIIGQLYRAYDLPLPAVCRMYT